MVLAIKDWSMVEHAAKEPLMVNIAGYLAKAIPITDTDPDE